MLKRSFEKYTDNLDVKEQKTPTKLGKDPDGNKAGVNVVNPKFASRLFGYYVKYKIKKTDEDVIRCLSPYTGREEIVLQLISVLPENDKDTLPKVDDYMKKYKGMDYTQIVDNIQNSIQSTVSQNIDLIPIKSIIVPISSGVAIVDNDDDDDDGMSVFTVQKMKQLIEGF